MHHNNALSRCIYHSLCIVSSLCCLSLHIVVVVCVPWCALGLSGYWRQTTTQLTVEKERWFNQKHYSFTPTTHHTRTKSNVWQLTLLAWHCIVQPGRSHLEIEQNRKIYYILLQFWRWLDWIKYEYNNVSEETFSSQHVKKVEELCFYRCSECCSEWCWCYLLLPYCWSLGHIDCFHPQLWGKTGDCRLGRLGIVGLGGLGIVDWGDWGL